MQLNESASIILLRKQPITMAQDFHKDYQVLILKRTEGSFVGGYYAFAGGKVEN